MMFTTFTMFSAFTMFTKFSKNQYSASYRALSKILMAFAVSAAVRLEKGARMTPLGAIFNICCKQLLLLQTTTVSAIDSKTKLRLYRISWLLLLIEIPTSICHQSFNWKVQHWISCAAFCCCWTVDTYSSWKKNYSVHWLSPENCWPSQLLAQRKHISSGVCHFDIN